ncbi:MAG: hypothetical protein JXP73_10230 [Deltaproteobacteria bacterium]|nr:hypothetical protein [Deltaproteobacteria bacterium]
MPELSCGNRDHCDVCGGTSFKSATFRNRRLICAACLAAIEAGKGTAPPVAQGGTFGNDTEGDPEGLSVHEVAFVDALAAGGSLTDGAKAAGISYRSAKRWHRKPEIARAIRARTDANMSQARATLASGAARAARQLAKLAESARPDAARIAACRTVIGQAAELGVIEELSARLAELESRFGGDAKGK